MVSFNKGETNVAKSDAQKKQVREFLGRIVTEALGWEHVEAVSVRTVPHIGFEDDGVNGEVRLRLTLDRGFAYQFTGYEIELARHDMLIERMKQQLENGLAKLVKA